MSLSTMNLHLLDPVFHPFILEHLELIIGDMGELEIRFLNTQPIINDRNK